MDASRDMTALTIGSLFAGYGGLTLAVQAALGGEVAWHAEVNPAARKVLAHRWPGIPNLGDVTTADWSTVPAVDILEGGYPCQADSSAGLRLGVDDDRWLWPAYLDALKALRPRLAVGENVQGHVQRGLRGVVADLQRAGYAVSWVTVAASDIGSCHQRERVFWLARPEDGSAPTDLGHPFGWLGDDGWGCEDLLGRSPVGRWPYAGTAYAGTGPELLPTPRTTDTNGVGHHGDGGLDLRTAVSLLPTPTRRDDKGRTSPAGSVRGDGRVRTESDYALPMAVAQSLAVGQWGKYGRAIARQEEAFGIPAPAPTGPHGRGGEHRLSGRFTEWMMGLDPGWITDVPGVTNNDAIRMCGNGVVWRQAETALQVLSSRLLGQAVAA
jgi:DNA (cytosine-5)-methyltransferase 1